MNHLTRVVIVDACRKFWVDRHEVAERTGVSFETAKKYLQYLHREGVLERKKYQAPWGGWHYVYRVKVKL
jgi:predicted transcriptional regulator